ncbi:hypothetical protein [Sulfobacillus thermosulfidooxidans]|uniref:hypothetical protein n=1 Tax=Sulfobacillus thermosulfidooxidans TaxID=28034 RepID=UPI000B1C1754|nr:hypothetical protein [Sulfobacillus thermosulfidooxidans]
MSHPNVTRCPRCPLEQLVAAACRGDLLTWWKIWHQWRKTAPSATPCDQCSRPNRDRGQS